MSASARKKYAFLVKAYDSKFYWFEIVCILGVKLPILSKHDFLFEYDHWCCYVVTAPLCTARIPTTCVFVTQVEYIRKLTLSGVLVFCKPGSVSQSFFGEPLTATRLSFIR